jgi:hypothetical protein
MTIPLVPPNALGEVTHVGVGVPVQFGVDSDVVIVELSKYDCWVELPTPKNNMSEVPL